VKGIEKNKAQKLILKIEKGQFDENDIDSLFMRMRAYSNKMPVFREIADFVAHNDQRDRGLANQSLETMYLRMKYFLEYNSPKKSLDISSPFPLWIKRLMVLQVNKFKESVLKEKFNVTQQRLKSRIENAFKVDKKNKTATLKDGKLSQQTLEAIQHIMGFLVSDVAFTQEELITELVNVIVSNKLQIEKDLFLKQSDKIALCTLLLLHNATFDFKGHKLGYTQISTEKESISHNTKFVDGDGNEVEHIESFGNLHVTGWVVLNNNGKDVTMGHPIMSTNLDAETWCVEELFHIEPFNDDMPNHMCKRIKLKGDLTISDCFRIGEIAV
jgi:hypothetical protein